MSESSASKYLIQAKIKEFTLPPVFDGLILGKNAPIGIVAFSRALELLVVTPFEHITLEDEIVGDILVRQNILRRISRTKLTEFVLQRVKPMMGANEVMHLEINAEVFFEEPL